MKQKILEKSQKEALKAGFDDVKHLGKWKVYEIIEPIFTDDEIHFIGYPQYLLVKGDSIRWTKDYNESLAIMDAFDK